jgi:hypothetical protein
MELNPEIQNSKSMNNSSKKRQVHPFYEHNHINPQKFGNLSVRAQIFDE